MKISNRFLIILTALILVLALGGFALTQYLMTRNLDQVSAKVVVTVDTKPYGTYSLNEDQTVKISPEDGSWYNTLQIKDGVASVIESDCDNQICVHTPGLTEYFSFPIVCLPHGVVVELAQ